MFPDSEIAKPFHCVEQKANCLVSFGVVSYVQSQLCDKVKKANDHVVLLDESLNDVLQSKQMDVLELFGWNQCIYMILHIKVSWSCCGRTLQDELYDCCVGLGLASSPAKFSAYINITDGKTVAENKAWYTLQG